MRQDQGAFGRMMVKATIQTPSQPPAAKAAMTVVVVGTPILAVISPSPVAVFLSGLSLVIIIALLWREDEPPILLLPVLFQWSEVAAFPLATIWKQVPLNDMLMVGRFGADLDTSAAYGFAGVTALAMGLRRG